MRISCPSCQTLYEVPDAMVDPAKALRCARCGQEWAVGPPRRAMEPVPFDPVAMPPSPERAPPLATLEEPPHPHDVARPPRRQPRSWLLGWLLSLLAIAGLLAAAYVFRAEIVAAWPPSQRVFLGLGLR